MQNISFPKLTEACSISIRSIKVLVPYISVKAQNDPEYTNYNKC